MTSTYASAPLLLNLERADTGGGSGSGGDSSGGSSPPTAWHLGSRWCNLGLWPESASLAAETPFQSACAALATAVGDAAALRANDAVLDVGVGYAEQTALWVERYGVRRVVAIEPSRAHVEAARRAQRDGSLAGAGVVELLHGSASSLLTTIHGGDQVSSASASSFDAVVCLDCAYHFRTRASFLRDAAALLKPGGGRFAAADLIVADDEATDTSSCSRSSAGSSAVKSSSSGDVKISSSWWRRWWRRMWRAAARRLIAALCDIPGANLHGADEYVAALEAAGLQPTAIEPIGTRVLRPFSEHARRQRDALRASGAIGRGEWLALSLIGALFAFVARNRLFEMVLVSAVRVK